MSERAVVKNAFSALNKKKKKSTKVGESTRNGLSDASKLSNRNEANSDSLSNIKMSTDWADDDDDEFEKDAFHDDGFIAPTKTAGRYRQRIKQQEMKEPPPEESEEEDITESESESESEPESPSIVKPAITESKTKSSKISKANNKKPNKEVEDIDAILNEMAITNEKSGPTDSPKEEISEQVAAPKMSEAELAAQEALKSLLPESSVSDGASKSKKKKNKNKGKKKKPSKEETAAPSAGLDAREAAKLAISNLKKKKAAASSGTGPKGSEERVRMEKVKKKKDKSKFNQIPAHLLN